MEILSKNELSAISAGDCCLNDPNFWTNGCTIGGFFLLGSTTWIGFPGDYVNSLLDINNRALHGDYRC